MPTDRDRLLERGYHPARQLAHGLSARWSIPVVPLLVRRHRAPRQAALGRADRTLNVRDAFLAVAIPPPSVVLVDDVYTTGESAAAASGALLRGGATTVSVVTFARTLRA
jgi:predicted amidophosphoribosyltransferase